MSDHTKPPRFSMPRWQVLKTNMKSYSWYIFFVCLGNTSPLPSSSSPAPNNFVHGRPFETKKGLKFSSLFDSLLLDCSYWESKDYKSIWNCTLIPSVPNSCYIIYKGLVFNYSMQNVLSAVGWCIHTPCCVLLFISGTHPGKSNPQWGTSSSCSIYTVRKFPGILSAVAIWQGNFFIAQNTFSCQWRFSVLGLVWCFTLVCCTGLDADVKPYSYQHRSLESPSQFGKFYSKLQIIHRAQRKTQPK